VVAMLLDVFVSVVVPRRAPGTGRLSTYLVRYLWRAWRAIGLRMGSAGRRESFLGTFGALAVILLLIAWVAGLVLGYGLMLHALRSEIRPPPEHLGTALYFAGTSLFTS